MTSATAPSTAAAQYAATSGQASARDQADALTSREQAVDESKKTSAIDTTPARRKGRMKSLANPYPRAVELDHELAT